MLVLTLSVLTFYLLLSSFSVLFFTAITKAAQIPKRPLLSFREALFSAADEVENAFICPNSWQFDVDLI